MSEITKQSGASSSTPTPFMRWFSSKLMNYVGSENRQEANRKKREAKRRKQGRKHIIEYFHQVDDGYSHLAIQALPKLQTKYDVDIIVHYIPSTQDDNFPEPELWKEMSRTDAKHIAPYYGFDFDSADSRPNDELVQLALSILCRLDNKESLTVGVTVSDFLWKNDKEALDTLANQYSLASQQDINERFASGLSRRRTLKHYNSAMFFYEGEWYWGVDRLYHLEQRLKSLGADSSVHLPMVAPRPVIPTQFGKRAANMILEFYVSLRSPYTAIAWEPTIKLAKDSGINLLIKPVLPMVMRGVPATREKKLYIAMDAAREARAMQVAYGHFYDPIGEPVLHGYSLYMWAQNYNKGNDVLGAFLKAAFAEGINCNSQRGLQKVVQMAGLDWQEARHHLHDTSWQPLLENNRQNMYEYGHWGVPSYRLLDENGTEQLSVWGQDRIWLIAKKIKELSQVD